MKRLSLESTPQLMDIHDFIAMATETSTDDKTRKENPDFISKKVKHGDYFFQDLNPDPNSPLTITCGGIEHCENNYSIERQHFDYFGLEFIASGCCCLSLKGKEYHLKAGSLFFYNPNTHHHIKHEGENELVKYFVDFAGTSSHALVNSAFSQKHQPLQIRNLRILNDLFHHLLHVGKQGGNHTQETLQLIIRLILNHIKSNALDIDEFWSQNYASYERCAAYLNQNFQHIHSVSELAKSCNLSTGYLSRIFKKFAQTSPSKQLMQLKMNFAAELLQHKGYLIKEVSNRIGIEDPYHFSRLFKQHYGLSPRNFQKSRLQA